MLANMLYLTVSVKSNGDEGCQFTAFLYLVRSKGSGQVQIKCIITHACKRNNFPGTGWIYLYAKDRKKECWLQLKEMPEQSLGRKNAPLLELELDHIIPDELHLVLRVMDMLIQALIGTAVAWDHYDAHEQGKRSIKGGEGPMVQNLVKRIKECGVHFLRLVPGRETAMAITRGTS